MAMNPMFVQKGMFLTVGNFPVKKSVYFPKDPHA